jgi:hypothetical protein
VKDKRALVPEVLLVFGGGELVEGGVDQAGAVFADRGLAGFQFVAEGQEFLDFGDDAALFGERR